MPGRGAVIIGNAAAGFFNDDQVRLTLPMAQQVALAVSNAQLFSQAEEERRKLNAILSDTADAVVVADLTGKIALVNRAARQAFGWGTDAVVGQSAEEALAAVEHLADLLTDAPLAEHAAAVEVETSGGRTYAATVAPVAGVGRAAVMRDITYLKELDRMRSA
jgi:PAS domain S-box-containing protein